MCASAFLRVFLSSFFHSSLFFYTYWWARYFGACTAKSNNERRILSMFAIWSVRACVPSKRLHLNTIGSLQIYGWKTHLNKYIIYLVFIAAYVWSARQSAAKCVNTNELFFFFFFHSSAGLTPDKILMRLIFYSLWLLRLLDMKSSHRVESFWFFDHLYGVWLLIRTEAMHEIWLNFRHSERALERKEARERARERWRWEERERERERRGGINE